MAQAAVNDRIRVTYNDLSIMSCPGYVSPCVRLGGQPIGALGTVIAGPTTVSGVVFWNVNYDTGVDGWSSQIGFMKVTTGDTTPPSPPEEFFVQ